MDGWLIGLEKRARAGTKSSKGVIITKQEAQLDFIKATSNGCQETSALHHKVAFAQVQSSQNKESVLARAISGVSRLRQHRLENVAQTMYLYCHVMDRRYNECSIYPYDNDTARNFNDRSVLFIFGQLFKYDE